MKNVILIGLLSIISFHSFSQIYNDSSTSNIYYTALKLHLRNLAKVYHYIPETQINIDVETCKSSPILPTVIDQFKINYLTESPKINKNKSIWIVRIDNEAKINKNNTGSIAVVDFIYNYEGSKPMYDNNGGTRIDFIYNPDNKTYKIIGNHHHQN